MIIISLVLPLICPTHLCGRASVVPFLCPLLWIRPCGSNPISPFPRERNLQSLKRRNALTIIMFCVRSKSFKMYFLPHTLFLKYNMIFRLSPYLFIFSTYQNTAVLPPQYIWQSYRDFPGHLKTEINPNNLNLSLFHRRMAFDWVI